MPQKSKILSKLKDLKPTYEKEGLILLNWTMINFLWNTKIEFILSINDLKIIYAIEDKIIKSEALKEMQELKNSVDYMDEMMRL